MYHCSWVVAVFLGWKYEFQQSNEKYALCSALLTERIIVAATNCQLWNASDQYNLTWVFFYSFTCETFATLVLCAFHSISYLDWPFLLIVVLFSFIYGVVMDSNAKASDCGIRVYYFSRQRFYRWDIYASWWQLYLYDSLDTNMKTKHNMTPFDGLQHFFSKLFYLLLSFQKFSHRNSAKSSVKFYLYMHAM